MEPERHFFLRVHCDSDSFNIIFRGKRRRSNWKENRDNDEVLMISSGFRLSRTDSPFQSMLIKPRNSNEMLENSQLLVNTGSVTNLHNYSITYNFIL